MSENIDDKDQQANLEEIGKLNAEIYEAKKAAQGEPLKLKDVEKVIFVDAIILIIASVFWNMIVSLTENARLTQTIILVTLLLVDGYLLRKVKIPGEGFVKTKYSDGPLEHPDDSIQDSYKH